jgi:hypothetical protein
MIAATALTNGHSVMTANAAEFARILGLTGDCPQRGHVIRCFATTKEPETAGPYCDVGAQLHEG